MSASSRPVSPALFHSARSTCCCLRQRSWCGTTSCATKRRTASRKVSSSGVIHGDVGFTCSSFLYAVHGDDAGAAEAQVVLQRDACALDLACARAAAQLVGQLEALGKAGG